MPYDVSADEFCRIWERSQSVAEAARTLRASAASVSATASKYRRRGVPLKRFGSVALDVLALRCAVEGARALTTEAPRT